MGSKPISEAGTRPNETTTKRRVRAGIYVSDHAIVRYLERVLGIDIEQLKDQIISDELLRHVEKFGTTGAFPVNGENPYLVILDKKQIVTILPNNTKHYLNLKTPVRKNRRGRR